MLFGPFSGLKFDRRIDLIPSPLELAGIVDCNAVHGDVSEDNGRDVGAHELAGAGGFAKCAMVEDKVRQGRFAAVDVDMASVILECGVHKSEVIQSNAVA